MARRKNDAYYTPEGSLGPALKLAGFPKNVDVLEPSAGDGALVRELRALGYTVWANEPYPPGDFNISHDSYLDMSVPNYWYQLRVTSRSDAVVGNPPYKLAPEFVRYALQAGYRHVFFLLRLSWLERCQNRSDLHDSGFLRAVIVTPRLSFTGDGRKDSVTTAWFWYDASGSWAGDPKILWLK